MRRWAEALRAGQRARRLRTPIFVSGLLLMAGCRRKPNDTWEMAAATVAIMDPESYLSCNSEEPGRVRGWIAGQVWVSHVPPRERDMDGATVQVEVRDSTGAPLYVQRTRTNFQGMFDFTLVPLSGRLSMQVIDPRIPGGWTGYLAAPVASLFGRCIRPEIDRHVRLESFR
jgi:hypothetical protein